MKKKLSLLYSDVSRTEYNIIALLDYQNRSYAVIYMMKYNTYEMFLAADVIKQR